MSNEETVKMLSEEGYAVKTICETLQVSRSNYYRKAESCGNISSPRDKSNEELVELIKTVKLEHPYWGYRRVRARVSKILGYSVNHKRIYRLMRNNGLMVDVKHYKAKRTVTRDKPRAVRKNEWWGTDMTKFYVQNVGWVYLVFVLDWYTKKIIGHKMGLKPNTGLWLDALRAAVDGECPLGSRSYGIHLMSDNGSQPTSEKYENELKTLWIDHVTTSFSNPKGNADTERVFRTFKEDVVWPNEFDSYDRTTAEVDRWVHFYNTEYPHSSLGEISPTQFENKIQNLAA